MMILHAVWNGCIAMHLSKRCHDGYDVSDIKRSFFQRRRTASCSEFSLSLSSLTPSQLSPLTARFLVFPTEWDCSREVSLRYESQNPCLLEWSCRVNVSKCLASTFEQSNILYHDVKLLLSSQNIWTKIDHSRWLWFVSTIVHTQHICIHRPCLVKDHLRGSPVQCLPVHQVQLMRCR